MISGLSDSDVGVLSSLFEQVTAARFLGLRL